MAVCSTVSTILKKAVTGRALDAEMDEHPEGDAFPFRRAVRGGGVVRVPAISTACPSALGRVGVPAPVDCPWKSFPCPRSGANPGRRARGGPAQAATVPPIPPDRTYPTEAARTWNF